MFVLLVAADVHGVKKNVELGFQLIPTLPELAKRINDAFTVERKTGRPAGHAVEPFETERLDLFDPTKKRWVRLVSPTQLVEWAQLYAVCAGQGRSVVVEGRAESASPLPAASQLASRLPRNPAEWSEGGLPAVPRWVYDREAQARMTAVWQEFDVTDRGFLTQDDFLRVFDANYMGVGKATIYDLFHSADADSDGRVSWNEFLPFFEKHPKLMQAIYYRTRQYWNDMGTRKESSQVNELLDFHKVKAARAQEEFERAQRDVAELERYVEARRRAVREAPLVEQEQEQILLEHEARLRQMHEELSGKERQLQQQKDAFVRRHGRAPGSPRPVYY